MADPKTALKSMNIAFEALERLDQDERQRAMAWLSETLGTSVGVRSATASPAPPSIDQPAAPEAQEGQSVEELTPKQFVASKQPATDVERLTCLAYYLTKARGTPEFTTADLTALNTEAAGRRFTNAAATGKNATNKSGFLTGATGRNRQITHLGEQVVEAMPDRDAVKSVVAAVPKPRKRSNRSKRATS